MTYDTKQNKPNISKHTVFDAKGISDLSPKSRRIPEKKSPSDGSSSISRTKRLHLTPQALHKRIKYKTSSRKSSFVVNHPSGLTPQPPFDTLILYSVILAHPDRVAHRDRDARSCKTKTVSRVTQNTVGETSGGRFIRCKPLVLGLLLPLWLASASAVEIGNKVFASVPNLDTPPKIDGQIEEKEWQ
ncbi:MAG: hypothetical protein KJ964_05955, partial [Verrucomicrobia bacterium]|nr:hypothetical protein [Verrucomicrobiota bacterium]MBU1736351.1 hypothetical protein [Verrucomicrobiota bacterium]MBU1857346.1 hypothetical protein [Verrucomicrobiota bacterium]